ncbi:unnamed protein product [Urochloa humidicola]
MFPRLQQSSFPCAFPRLHDTILHCSTRQPSTTTQVGKSNLKSQDSKQHSDSDLFPQAPYAKLEGGDEELDGEPVVGLTWKLIEESCAAEDVTRLRRSARLAQARDVDEDEFHSEGEDEPTNEDDIEFESEPEDVVPITMESDGDGENDD